MSDVAAHSGPWRRRIGSYGGQGPGPSIVAVCGIHGNERAGVRAAEMVLEGLHARRPPFRGEFVAIGGNLAALARNTRFVDKDLNRVWTPEGVLAVRSRKGAPGAASEDGEQFEILEVLEGVFARQKGPIYFLDLHTSSADGPPFATMGDTLRNRAFVTRLPVPVILGLEEQIDGALLEWVNNLGHITMGVEAGRHDHVGSVECHEAILWLCLIAAGCLEEDDVPEAAEYRERVRRASNGIPGIVEIRHRHAIRPEDGFRMNPGYVNYAPIRRGEVLGVDAKGPVRAREGGIILLPLYQGQGDDGFFIGRQVRPFWLKLSALLRHLGLTMWPRLLPGVRRHPKLAGTLIVDTRVARFYPLDLFHLLGYRKRRWSGRTLIVTRRNEELG